MFAVLYAENKNYLRQKNNFIKIYAPVAQLVERWSEEPGVAGSNPVWGTIGVIQETPQKWKKGDYFMYDIDDLIFGDNMEPIMSSR